MPETRTSAPIRIDSPAVLARPGAVIAVLSAGGVLVSLAQTLIVPLIGELPSIFSTSPATASWIITITLLAGAISTPITGRLADMYGKKLLLLVALGFFIAGSLLATAATGVGFMILARGLQGVASGMVPLGISILHDMLPRKRAGKAIALMSSSMGIGGALGLPFAAGIIQFAHWRILFVAVAVLAVGVGIALAWILPGSHNPRRQERFDLFGAFGLALGLGAILLAVSKGTDWGWTSGITIGGAATGILVLIGWGVYQTKARAPLINLRTVALRPVLLTNLASILIGFTMFALNLLVPPVMQLPVASGYGLGQSMIAMSVWVMPVGIGMMAVSSVGAAISHKHTPRITLAIAGIVIAAGYSATALILATVGNRVPGTAPETTILLTLILFSTAGIVVGAGIGLAFGSIPAVIMAAAPARETAAANGVNALMRSLGTTSSSAILGVLLAAHTVDVAGRPTPTLGAYLTGLGLAAGLALIASGLAAAVPTSTFTTRDP